MKTDKNIKIIYIENSGLYKNTHPAPCGRGRNTRHRDYGTG